MGIGLPLLQTLTVSQLRAVLAHEFGHYYSGDTKLGPLIHRTNSAIGRSLRSLARHNSILQLPFQWYGKLFLRITHAISRRQEFVADELAARTVGARAMITGLQAVHCGAMAFDAYWGGEVVPVLNSGNRPPLAEGFSHFVGTEHVSQAVKRSLEASLKQVKSDLYDTHPSLPERIAALKQFPLDDLPAADPQAVELVDGLPALEREMLVALTDREKVAGLKPMPWSEAALSAYLPVWQKVARSEAEALQGVTPETLPVIAQHLSAFAQTLARAQERDTPFEEPHKLQGLALSVLGSALVATLYDHGWELSALPGEPIYARKDEHVIKVFDAIADLAADELLADAWLRECAAAGISKLDLGRV
ncbi:MAG: M48 family metalloprotease [Chloroflexota bacterium]